MASNFPGKNQVCPQCQEIIEDYFNSNICSSCYSIINTKEQEENKNNH